MMECGSEGTLARGLLAVLHMVKIFVGPKFRRKFILVLLIFVAGWTDENILTSKISRSTVVSTITA